MTTAAEIKKWTRPLFDRRNDIALRRHVVVVVPIGHISRAIWFMGSSDRTYPHPWWQFHPAFGPRGIGGEGHWNVSIPVGYSTAPNFIGRLTNEFFDRIENDLAPVDSIEAFFEKTSDDQPPKSQGGYWPLSRVPGYHAVVLAALGRLQEAAEVIDKLVAMQEPGRLTQLANGKALVAKRSNSVIGRMDMEFATDALNVLSEFKQLASLAKANDRAGVAALLHQWEEANIKRWQYEDLWTPTPFPIELGASD